MTEIADPGRVELAGEPLPSVGPNLDGVGQPGLGADVHEAKLGVDQVEVVVHALALTGTGPEPVGGRVGPDVEGPRRLDDADDADQPLGHPVTGRDLAGEVFFGLAVVAGGGMVEVDERSPRLGSHGLHVGSDRCGRLLGIA